MEANRQPGLVQTAYNIPGTCLPYIPPTVVYFTACVVNSVFANGNWNPLADKETKTPTPKKNKEARGGDHSNVTLADPPTLMYRGRKEADNHGRGDKRNKKKIKKITIVMMVAPLRGFLRSDWTLCNGQDQPSHWSNWGVGRRTQSPTFASRHSPLTPSLSCIPRESASILGALWSWSR